MKKGMKSPQCIIPGSGRENITVQVACSASGELLPPYIIYSGQRLMKDLTFGGPIGTRFSVSPNGWMTGPNFIDWLKSLFIPSLPAERPVLLILDGHASHVSYEVRIIGRDNEVHLLKLPPHLTHLLQPLDLSVFKPMKTAWDAATSDFVRRERRAIVRRDFPGLLNIVWKKGYKEENAKKGFERAGIVPFNSEVIPDSSLHYAEPFYPTQASSEPSEQSSTSTTDNPNVSIVEMLAGEEDTEYIQYDEFIFSQPYSESCNPQTSPVTSQSSSNMHQLSSPVHATDEPINHQLSPVVNQQSPITPSPVHQQSSISPSPVHQQSSISPSPVHQQSSISPSPAHQQSSISPSPVHQQSPITPSPVHQ